VTRTMTRPWHEIVRHYSALKDPKASVRALADLASRIADSPYRDGLFAWTSMLNLYITQTEVTYPYFGPFLCISPVADDRLEFRFVDTPDPTDQWHREVSAEQAYDRLETFLHRDLKWFSPMAPPAS
jgi:hypothetical protein